MEDPGNWAAVLRVSEKVCSTADRVVGLQGALAGPGAVVDLEDSPPKWLSASGRAGRHRLPIQTLIHPLRGDVALASGRPLLMVPREFWSFGEHPDVQANQALRAQEGVTDRRDVVQETEEDHDWSGAKVRYAPSSAV